jgi:UDP-N-acetyl-2-amino-2-deoxyglucuronate dehydrogenase
MQPISKDRKIRIAVVGGGRISKNHFDSIKQYDDLELVAVCDVDKQTLDIAVDEHGVDGFLHLQDMLDHSKCDVIAICTPSGIHPEQAITSAERGVHVITEKPMATRWSGCD